MAAAVAPPLCTWLVAACLSAACGAGEKEKQRKYGGGSGLFDSRRRLGARRRGGARSGMPMAVALHPERGAVENKKPDIKQRRVVVTGMGVVTPLGHDPDEFYNNLLQGVSGISEIESFDCSNYPTRIAGEIKSFSTDGWVAPKLAKRMDKFMQYLITAGKKALENGGITEEIMNQLEKSRCGVLIGSALGGMKVFSDAIEALRVSYRKMNPFCVPFATTNMGSAILAMDLGWMGPNYSISTACATSNFCILNAANHIIRGEADVMLCGGSDAPLTPIGLGGFVACRALSQRNSEPTKASRPWDVDRDGFVMGEGAGVLLLEELEHAKQRGAEIHAEFLGGSFTCDAYHMTEPHPEGRGELYNQLHGKEAFKQSVLFFISSLALYLAAPNTQIIKCDVPLLLFTLIASNEIVGQPSIYASHTTNGLQLCTTRTNGRNRYPLCHGTMKNRLNC